MRGEAVGSDSEAIPAVAQYLRHFLDAAPLTLTYREAIVGTLGASGRVLSRAPEARWVQCVCTCCVAAGGHWKDAVPDAVAVEVFMTALDLVDDVEDGDGGAPDGVLSASRLINVSTGLLLLAQQILAGRAEWLEPADLLLSFGLDACCGQDADLTPAVDQEAGLEDALAVTERKSGSLVAAACQLGARCGGADRPLQELYAQFGRYVGMVSQLANDLAAVAPGADWKSDIRADRPTLPLVYARQTFPPTVRAGEAAYRVLLWAGGPAHVTWTVAEAYRRYALDLLPRLSTKPVDQRALARLIRIL